MNLINENKYEVTKQLFEKHNIDMPESDTKIYASVFEVIAYFVNNKLTDEEIFLSKFLHIIAVLIQFFSSNRTETFTESFRCAEVFDFQNFKLPLYNNFVNGLDCKFS